ncbi:MAG: DUF2085 domain-containing protein [Acidobacteria bacterium]|nr:DUF2085 domain-containing protein [Acidobacteriota bacterium]
MSTGRTATVNAVLTATLAVTGTILTFVLIATVLPHPWRDAARLPFSMICHGIPERSLRIADHLLPICARCTGIYLGGILAALAALLLRVRSASLALGIVLMIPLAIDGTGQALGIWTTGNPARFATGMLFAVGFVTAAVAYARRRSEPEVLESTLSMR